MIKVLKGEVTYRPALAAVLRKHPAAWPEAINCVAYDAVGLG